MESNQANQAAKAKLAAVKNAFLNDKRANGDRWMPEPNDIITGVITINEFAGKWGPSKRYEIAEHGTNKTYTVFGCASLDGEIEHHEIVNGDNVAILYRGTVKMRNGKEIKSYRVQRTDKGGFPIEPQPE